MATGLPAVFGGWSGVGYARLMRERQRKTLVKKAVRKLSVRE